MTSVHEFMRNFLQSQRAISAKSLDITNRMANANAELISMSGLWDIESRRAAQAALTGHDAPGPKDAEKDQADN